MKPTTIILSLSLITGCTLPRPFIQVAGESDFVYTRIGLFWGRTDQTVTSAFINADIDRGSRGGGFGASSGAVSGGGGCSNGACSPN